MKGFQTWLKAKAKLVIIVMSAAAIGSVTGAVALAAIPDANGVIHGCYVNKNGTLHIIDSATQTCNSNQTALNWSQGSSAKIYSKQIILAPTDPAQTIFTIPGIGDITIDPTGCLDQNVGVRIGYHNTTTGAVMYTSPGGGGNASSVEVPANGTQTTIDDGGFLSSGTGNNQVVARVASSIDISGDLGDNQCGYVVQATVSQ